MTYVIELEQRCGVNPHTLGTTRFGESAVLVLPDDPSLSRLKFGGES